MIKKSIQNELQIPLLKINSEKARVRIVTSTYSAIPMDADKAKLDSRIFDVGVYSDRTFVPGIMASSTSHFIPGRALIDSKGSPSFFPGLDIGKKFVPGVIYGTVFYPGVYYCGKFIPGIFKKNRFVIGKFTPSGFEEVPDPSDIGGLLHFGNPFNWDLSESYTPIDEPPDFARIPHEDAREGAKDRIEARYQLPVGYGNGSKPNRPPDGFTLPGHDEPLSWERERAKYDMLDLDSDGVPELGLRVNNPLAQPSIGEDEGSFFIMPVGGLDIGLRGSSIGIGSGSTGGGGHDPREGIEGLLGGLYRQAPVQVQLGDPDSLTGTVVVELLVVIAVVSVAVIGILILTRGCEKPAPPPEDPQ